MLVRDFILEETSLQEHGIAHFIHVSNIDTSNCSFTLAHMYPLSKIFPLQGNVRVTIINTPVIPLGYILSLFL
jgi:hypothetical protein